MTVNYELEREKDENLFYKANVDNVCPGHFHKKIELLYVLEGEKKVITNNKMITLTKGQLFIADSYVIHAYLDSRNSKQICVVFPNFYLSDYFKLYGDKILDGNLITDTDYTSMLLPFILNIETLDEKDSLLFQANINMLLGYVVKKIGVSDKEYTYNIGLIGDIISYINDNYSQEITLDKLADEFGYSKYYFSRLFNSCMGTSITDYISIIRLNKVLEMLKKEDTTIADAIFACGFNSIPTFYRVLKKNYVYKKLEDLLI